jgi:hypothetical protein
VVDGVGDQVAQRLGDRVEHPHVELDLVPLHGEGDLAAGGGGDVPNEPFQSTRDARHRSGRQAEGPLAHPAEAPCGVLEASAPVTAAPGPPVEQGRE